MRRKRIMYHRYSPGHWAIMTRYQWFMLDRKNRKWRIRIGNHIPKGK